MHVLLTAVGATLVVVALRDVFHTLFHPEGTGTLSRVLATATWRLAGRLGHGARGIAGGVAVISTLATWTGVLVVSFALIYLPRLPEGFSYGSTLDPSPRAGLVDALYTSTVVLATLGFGDIVPVDPWLRLVVPVQALVGFALLTAGLSWIQQIQPALGRRRGLARQLTALFAALDRTGTTEADPAGPGPSAVPPGVLHDVAARLARVHIDLRQSSHSFYFADEDPTGALARVLPFARRLAQRAAEEDSPDGRDLRRAGVALGLEIDGFARLLAAQFLQGRSDGTTDDVLRRFAAEHAPPQTDA